MGRCFNYHDFSLVSVSETSCRNLHTKINPNPISYDKKNLSRDIKFFSWRYLLSLTLGLIACKYCTVHVSIILHFLDRFTQIYQLKHTVKSHWISLNNCIKSKSWKYYLTYQVNIQKMKSWMTLIYTVRRCKVRKDNDFYNNVVYCMNSLFMKHFLVLNWLFSWQYVFISTYLIST